MINNPNPPASVLIVDDAADTLAMLTDALSRAGMEVTVAQSGREALAAVGENMPDLVLMDAMMPGMDGFETCQILKAEKDFADVPVVFMTGFNETEHVVRAMESGGVDFVAKPIPLDELFARIRVHLTNARRARSAHKALDSTGRRIVACTDNGVIQWSTPQAAKLMSRSGLRSDEGTRLPWDIIDWLGRKEVKDARVPASFHMRKNGTCIEFRMLERAENGDILLRLLDCDLGTDEDRLSERFGLTLREAEVLLWITHGKSNKEIAEILDMSPRTVNKHLEQIFSKLGSENRTAAATMAVRVLWQED